MSQIVDLPLFTVDGLLPAGDYEFSINQLQASILVLGQREPRDYSNWDASWREKLVENLGTLCDQLWQTGITEIFVDGPFVEDKYHPNDVKLMGTSDEN